MTDILINYVPDSGKQADFHDAREVVRYRGAFSGKGGGKTLSGLAEGLLWSMKYPGCVGWAGEPSYPMVERNLIPTLESPELLNCRPFQASPLIKKYNSQKHKIEWVNGSVTWLGSLEYPESVEGANYDWFFIDEGRLVKKFLLAWQVLTARLRGTGVLPEGVHPSGWVTSTPSPKGSEMYMLFGDPVERIPASRTFHWSQLDNPHLTQEFLLDQDAIYRDEEERKAMIEGDWPNLASGSYAFDWDVHVIREQPKQETLKRIAYGIDWGWDNPFCLGAWGFDYDNRAYRIDEVYLRHQSPEDIIAHCKRFVEMYGKGTFWCGHEEPKSIDQLRRAGLDAKANKTKREEGIRYMGGLFPVCADGKPRIYVMAHCKGFLAEVVEYDSEVKENDHAMDESRYCLINEKMKPVALFGSVRSPFGRGAPDNTLGPKRGRDRWKRR